MLFRSVSDAQRTEDDKIKFQELKRNNFNEKLEELVCNKFNPGAFIEDGRIYSSGNPVFRNPIPGSFIRAQFFAPNKYLFGSLMPTFWVNLVVIWFMAIVLGITLYYDVFRKVLEWIGKLISNG